MNWVYLSLAPTILLIGVLLFLSALESAIFRLSKVSLRVLSEKVQKKLSLLEQIVEDRNRFVLPLQFGIQLVQVAIIVLLTVLCLSSNLEGAAWMALVVAACVIVVFRQVLPKMISRSDPERALLRLLAFYESPHRLLLILSAPLVSIIKVLQPPRNGESNHRTEESTEEEIQAYLGVGEEEGIIEEEESELIQSALEFGDTLVREIMTPRTQIVAIEEGASLSELKNLMVSRKHSRIPVYRDNLGQIVGVVYIRNLLAHLDEGRGEDAITTLIKKVWFVPETKRVHELLKEMQKKAENLAVVVSEYGDVSGLVTIEDLVEELVGEIYDEDETLHLDLVYEGKGSYIVRGGVEIEELEETLGLDLDDVDVTTVSGLVVGHLGRVPAPGEVIRLKNARFEVLSSDRRKIQTMRVRRLQDPLEEGSSGSGETLTGAREAGPK